MTQTFGISWNAGGLICVLAGFMICATPALAERVMICELRSASDSTKVLDIRTIREGTDGHVTMESRPSGTFAMVAKGGEAPILFQETTDNSTMGPRFTTLLVASTHDSERYTPVTWLVDWDERRLLHTNLGARNAEWTVFTRYQCAGGA